MAVPKDPCRCLKYLINSKCLMSYFCVCVLILVTTLPDVSVGSGTNVTCRYRIREALSRHVFSASLGVQGGDDKTSHQHMKAPEMPRFWAKRDASRKRNTRLKPCFHQHLCKNKIHTCMAAFYSTYFDWLLSEIDFLSLSGEEAGVCPSENTELAT